MNTGCGDIINHKDESAVDEPKKQNQDDEGQSMRQLLAITADVLVITTAIGAVVIFVMKKIFRGAQQQVIVAASSFSF